MLNKTKGISGYTGDQAWRERKKWLAPILTSLLFYYF